MKKTLLLILLSPFVLSSCLKDKTEPIVQGESDCFPQSYFYNIRPIIETSCKTGLGGGTGCHDAWIDEYSNVKAYLDLGTWQTEIFVDHTMPEMPNSFGIDSLTEAELTSMQCWIDQGYPDN